MKKKKLKRLIVICLVFVLNVTSFAAIIQDNDGTAFVTKREFDTLKHSFSQQIFDYNSSIDGKIDGAIAEYISGISYTPIETKKVLYPCNADDTIWCIAKGTYDRVIYRHGFPYFYYYGLIAQVDAKDNYANYNYSKNKINNEGYGTPEDRIIVTSNDGFVSDFVWDRYAKDVKTHLNCFAYTNTFNPGAWGDVFTIFLYDAVPNLTSGSGYYPDFNAIQDFVYFLEWHVYGPRTRWPGTSKNQIIGDKVTSNVVTLTSGTTVYEQAIVYNTGTDRYVCIDDPHWVNTDCDEQVTQDAFSRTYLTFTNEVYFSQSGGKATGGRENPTTLNQTLTNKMPVFGMYSNKIDMATVKSKTNVITYNNGTETLTDIKLINGVPLLYEKKGAYVEWTPIMGDMLDYNFYLSTTKFTGAPDPSTCIEVSVDGGTPTKTPLVKSGQKLSFTMPSDGVVWLKWAWASVGDGYGELALGKCSEYTVIDRS